MSHHNSQNHQFTSEDVLEEIQKQPHLFTRLAENALTVSESLRSNYFKNTSRVVAALRKTINEVEQGIRTEPILKIEAVDTINWSDCKDEVVTFIDGGLGQVQISSQIPILLRVGSYSVKTGERQLSKREEFGYYPIILGDLEGGSKDRKDFTDIVRITAELLGGLSALERNPDLKLLMFHGPLVYTVGHYVGHTPFTEGDIDLFLNQYAQSPQLARELKESFLREAKINIYPEISPGDSDKWINQRLFEPLSWMAFLLRQLIAKSKKHKSSPMIAGVVERDTGFKEFSEQVWLKRLFKILRNNNKQDYFNDIYKRTDLNSPKAFLEKLNYTDTLLLSMLLKPGQVSESWIMRNKYAGLNKGTISLPNESSQLSVDWGYLRSNESICFPDIRGFYVNVSHTTNPIRVEVFDELTTNYHIKKIAQNIYLYARLLPGYGFPVGLDIVDKYAHVPNWMTDAYSKLIKYQLGISLQSGEIDDAEMRRILVQAIYMTKRDWLFRPQF